VYFITYGNTKLLATTQLNQYRFQSFLGQSA